MSAKALGWNVGSWCTAPRQRRRVPQDVAPARGIPTDSQVRSPDFPLLRTHQGGCTRQDLETLGKVLARKSKICGDFCTATTVRAGAGEVYPLEPQAQWIDAPARKPHLEELRFEIYVVADIHVNTVPQRPAREGDCPPDAANASHRQQVADQTVVLLQCPSSVDVILPKRLRRRASRCLEDPIGPPDAQFCYRSLPTGGEE
ncbi:hypothetical protein C8R47DRAFT_1079040 [Mycena vitilis]|nr:hypothetical protein C8R47DRAFT_1079040 [Mycena vitilis]